jgi:Pentapeptide repeats (8 copies)
MERLACAKSLGISGTEGCNPDAKRASVESIHGGPINLRRARLPDAFLRSASLKEANLEAANLSGADLVHAQLDRANLKNANLSHAVLEHADFAEARLSKANLSGANLTHARNLTQNQIDDTVGSASTTLPVHLHMPASWLQARDASRPASRRMSARRALFVGSAVCLILGIVVVLTARTDERIQAPEVTGVPTFDKSTSLLAERNNSGVISSIPSNPSRNEPQASKVGGLHQLSPTESPDAVAIAEPSIESQSPTEAPDQTLGPHHPRIDESSRVAAAEIGVSATPSGFSPHVVMPAAPLAELPSRPLPISKSEEAPPPPQELPIEPAVVTVTALPPQATTHPVEIDAPLLSAAESWEIPPLPSRKPAIRADNRALQAETRPDGAPLLSAAEPREIPPLPDRKPTVREANHNLQAGPRPDREPRLRAEKKAGATGRKKDTAG